MGLDRRRPTPATLANVVSAHEVDSEGDAPLWSLDAVMALVGAFGLVAEPAEWLELMVLLYSRHGLEPPVPWGCVWNGCAKV